MNCWGWNDGRGEIELTWVLMFAIMSGQGHSVNSQEFASKEACVNAKEVFLETFTNSWSGKPYAVCVPKEK